MGCPICGSDSHQFDLRINYWREHPLNFHRCSDCLAVFAEPMPSDEVITQGNEALVRWYQQNKTFEQETREARQAYLRGKLLARKLTRWKKRGRFLELGCYQGFLSLGVSENSDWEVEGVEISRELSHFISKKLKLTCHAGTLEEVGLPSDQYDFILCHDLIEHINQPQKFLKEIYRILKPGGRIEIITPNATQDLAFARRAFHQDQPVTMLLNHLLNFSPKALSIALRQVGFRINKHYCYDVRHVLKDFGWFGLGQPKGIQIGASIAEVLKLPSKTWLQEWDQDAIAGMKNHPKASLAYGFIRETLPRAVALKVPPQLGIGHEIYALAEKR